MYRGGQRRVREEVGGELPEPPHRIMVMGRKATWQ